MAIQSGLAGLLKKGAVSGSPVTIAGTTEISYTINNQVVDATTKDSGGMQELLASAGTQDWEVTITGLFNDGAAHNSFRNDYIGKTLNTYSIFLPNGDTFEASWYISNFSSSMPKDGAQTFTATLKSSGVVTYTNN